MLEHVLDHVFEKASEYVGDPENATKIIDMIATPVFKCLMDRFHWLFQMIQLLAALVVLQTIMLFVVLFRLR